MYYLEQKPATLELSIVWHWSMSLILVFVCSPRGRHLRNVGERCKSQRFVYPWTYHPHICICYVWICFESFFRIINKRFYVAVLRLIFELFWTLILIYDDGFALIEVACACGGLWHVNLFMDNMKKYDTLNDEGLWLNGLDARCIHYDGHDDLLPINIRWTVS